MALSLCSDPTRLQDLLDGALPECEEAELNEHLETCPFCQQTLEHLAAGKQTWSDVARHLGHEAAAASPDSSTTRDANTGARSPAATHDLSFLAPADKPGVLGRLGHYEVLEVIGKGGMGIVLKAFDEALHRVVAIKVLAPQLAANEVARQRFIREARAAAAIGHEHVVTIHAVEEANGFPYIVMQHVAGISLQQRIDRHGSLTLNEILRVGMQTAAGLAAAHAQGVVHRDIKPGNILLENGVERVKLTDFGLARAFADASVTQDGVVVGTPQYMAPEQARGEPMDQRSDLFSLGSVLYAMCTGRPPFRAGSPMAVLKRVCDDAPRSIREFNPEIPEWLVEIVAKLHAKNPADRFDSATAVAELLGRQLAPTAERPADRAVLPTFLRPRWRLLTAAAILFIAIVAWTAPQIIIRIRGKDGSVTEIKAPEGSKVEVVRDGKVEAVVPRAHVGEIRRFEGHDGRVSGAAFTPDGRYVLSAGWEDETSWLWDVESGKEIRRFEGRNGGVIRIVLSQDGRIALTSSLDTTLRLWDVQTGKDVRRFDGHTGSVWALALSRDGRHALSGANDNNRADSSVRLWEVKTGKELHRFEGPTQGVIGVAFSPDGRRALAGGRDKIMWLWDVETGKEIRRFEGHTDSVYCVAFSPDGRRVLSGSHDQTLRLWDVETGQQLRPFLGHRGPVSCVAFSPDGRRALSSSWDRTVLLWDAETGKLQHLFEGHFDEATHVTFSPDGRRALSCGAVRDKTVRLWQLPEPPPPPPVGEIRRFDGHEGRVNSVASSPDGRFVLSAGWQDKTVRLWDVDTGKELRRLEGHTDTIMSVAFSSDGQYAVGSGLEKYLFLWEVGTGKLVRRFEGHTGGVWTAALSRDGRRLLSGGKNSDPTVRLWEVDTGKEIRSFEGPTRHVVGVAFSFDGRLALAGGWDKVVWLWETETGKQLQRFEGHEDYIESVAFSPDGRRALSGSRDRTLRLWDVDSGKQLRRFLGHREAVNSVAFSPDGRRALSGGSDQSVLVWDIDTGKVLCVLDGHIDHVIGVAFSPDGRRALSCGSLRDQTVRLWQLPEPDK